MSQWVVCVQKGLRVILLMEKLVMVIVTVIVFGFFTGSGNVIPFSVDLSGFRRRLKVESKITMKIYIGHDVLLVNEVHKAIKRNSLFTILTTV